MEHPETIAFNVRAPTYVNKCGTKSHLECSTDDILFALCVRADRASLRCGANQWRYPQHNEMKHHLTLRVLSIARSAYSLGIRCQPPTSIYHSVFHTKNRNMSKCNWITPIGRKRYNHCKAASNIGLRHHQCSSHCEHQ